VEFVRWLDRGRPEGRAPAALAHAAGCATCARRWAAEKTLDRLLAEALPLAPAGFSDRLMARLPERRALPVLLGGETPWWLRAAADPAAVLALALLGLLTWLGGALWQAGSGSGPWLTELLARAARAVGLQGAFDLFRGREVVLGLELALACLLLFGTPAFVRWTARAGQRALTIRPL
jgi:hypothetical protein